VLILPGCGREGRIEKHRARGEEAYRAGRYEDAIIEALNVLKLAPSDARTMRILGLSYLRSKQPGLAIAALRRAVELDPDDTEVRAGLALLYCAIGEYQPARTNAAFVLDRQPTNSTALQLWCATAQTPAEVTDALSRLEALAPGIEDKSAVEIARGRLLLVQSNFVSAEAAFKQAASLDPDSAAPSSALGDLYLRQGRTNDAIQAFSAAASGASPDPFAAFRWAEIKREVGELDQAKQILEDLARSDPDYPSAGYRLAQIDLAEGRVDAAADRLKAVLERSPNFLPGLALEARLQWMRGDTAGAVSKLETLSERAPNFGPFHLVLGQIHARSGNPAQAVPPLETALGLNPNDPEVRLLLAEVRLRTGEPLLASQVLEGLSHEITNSARGIVMLGEAYLGQRRFPEAVDTFGQLVQMLPEEARAHHIYGLALTGAGQLAEARGALERALELDPGHNQSLWHLARLISRTESQNAAIARVRKHIEEVPESANPWLLLGNLNLAAQDVSAAEAAYRKAVELEPRSTSGYQMLVQICAATDRLPEAVELLDRALAVAPDDVATLSLAGSIYQTKTRELEKARAAYEKVLKLQPNAPAVANNLAILYLDLDLERAFALAQDAYRAVPESPAFKDTLALVVYRRGDHPWASSLLGEAAKQAPREPEIQFHLGMAQAALGREGQAKTNLLKALDLSSSFPGRSGAEALVRVLATPALKTDRALLDAARAEGGDVANHPAVRLRLSLSHEKEGDTNAVIVSLRSLAERNPAYFPAALHLARLYRDIPDQRAQALEILKGAYEQNPDEPEIATALGEALLDANDPRWALSLLERWRGERSGDPGFHLDLARAYFATGDARRARDQAGEALKNASESSAGAGAATLIEMIDLERQPPGDASALERIERVLRERPDHLAAQMALIAHWNKAGRTDRVLELCEQLYQKHPEFAPVVPKLADALYAHGLAVTELEPEKGASALRRALQLDPQSSRAPVARQVLANLQQPGTLPPTP
jgi:tetratricopeptide (TPR) repeat protein